MFRKRIDAAPKGNKHVDAGNLEDINMRHRTLNGFAVLPAASFNTCSSYSVLCPNHSSLQIPSHFAEGKISVIMWEWMCPTSSEMFSNSSHNSFCPLSEVVCGEQVLLSLPHLVSWGGTISKIKINRYIEQ